MPRPKKSEWELDDPTSYSLQNFYTATGKEARSTGVRLPAQALRRIEEIVQAPWDLLVDFNLAIINQLLEFLSIKIRVIRSSAMTVSGQRGELILDICRQLKADRYLSGISGKDYLDLSKFESASIPVTFQEFHHPIY